MLAIPAAASAQVKIGGGQTGTGTRPPPLVTDPGAAILAQPLGITAYQWKLGEGPRQLPPAKTHICLLTTVSGNFAGGGERLALYIDQGAQGGARWTLNGTAQGELRAEATCAARDKFVPGGALQATGYGNHMTGSCAPHVVPMPMNGLGYAFFISGISGKWRGGGESVSVSGPLGNQIRVTGCSGMADGTLMSVGLVPGKPVKYRTLSGRTAVLSAATTVVAMKGDDSTGFFDFAGKPFSVGSMGKTNWLAPVNEALCGIVALSGKFQGYGESAGVRVEKNSDGTLWWTAYVGNQAEVYNIRVGARCIARDQR